MYPHSYSKTVGAWTPVVWFTSQGEGTITGVRSSSVTSFKQLQLPYQQLAKL